MRRQQQRRRPVLPCRLCVPSVHVQTPPSALLTSLCTNASSPARLAAGSAVDYGHVPGKPQKLWGQGRRACARQAVELRQARRDALGPAQGMTAHMLADLDRQLSAKRDRAAAIAAAAAAAARAAPAAGGPVDPLLRPPLVAVPPPLL